jgi:oligopeptide/dipeptide ABC transporter ATP-binding protein
VRTAERGVENPTLVRVEDLEVHFPVRRSAFGRKSGVVRAVDGVSFQLQAGDVLGLAGESGSGKTTVARAMLRIIDPTGGRVLMDSQDISTLGRAELKSFRRRMQMVYQDPYDSLNPRLKIGATLEEALMVRGVRPSERTDGVRLLLERVGLSGAYALRYPHELSGGQRQRVSIARALGVEPSVIVCDEAVSSLDVSVRAQILNLLRDLQETERLSLLFISHDLSTLRFIADRVAIMYLGQVVEIGGREDIFDRPVHPYTLALLAAVPEPVPLRQRRPVARLTGEVPSAFRPPAGCRFHPRCPIAQDICHEVVPELRRKAAGHLAACHMVPDAAPIEVP